MGSYRNKKYLINWICFWKSIKSLHAFWKNRLLHKEKDIYWKITSIEKNCVIKQSKECNKNSLSLSWWLSLMRCENLNEREGRIFLKLILQRNKFRTEGPYKGRLKFSFSINIWGYKICLNHSKWFRRTEKK